MPSSGNISLNKKYVSRKISSVRWKPSVLHNSTSEVFVTGSWDGDENNLSVWYLNELEEDPNLVQEIAQNSNVNDIQYITRDVLAIGTGDGTIILYEHNDKGFLECKQSWKSSHHFLKGKAASTALASNGEQIASVGEDGRLIILNTQQEKPIKIIESESGCSDYAIAFIKAAEVLTGNMQGHLKLWDLRGQDVPKATLLSPDQISINHLACHPTQQHLVAAAGDDGALALWDMRSTVQPIVIIAAHNGPIYEAQFHPNMSDHLFTCGADGQVFHWEASSSSNLNSTNFKEKEKDPNVQLNAWFTTKVSQGVIDTESLIPASYLPINSLNIENNTLLAGSDNEALYVVKNIMH